MSPITEHKHDLTSDGQKFPPWPKFREMRNFYISFIVFGVQITLKNRAVHHRQGGLYTEVRLGDDMRISPFKLSKVKCKLIKLQIEFLLDKRVACNNKILYHQEIPNGPHH